MPSDDDEHRRRIAVALERPERVEPPLQRRHLLFRLSRRQLPISCAWTVMGPVMGREEGRPIVRELRLDHHASGAEDPFRVRDVELTTAVVDAWLAELREIRIPVGGVEVNIGLDGTTYSLSTEAGFAKLSVSWWVHGPPAWRELTGWAHRTMGVLHACTSPDDERGQDDDEMRRV
jgi:hypothetical protein